MVGREDYAVARNDLAGWLGDVHQPDPSVIECATVQEAWDTLLPFREDCLSWQCGV